MIICRKCQRHHPDSARTGRCECGADLHRDGIALVRRAELPPDDDGLDELPPLDTAPDRDASAPPLPAPLDEPAPPATGGDGAAARLQRRRGRGPSRTPAPRTTDDAPPPAPPPSPPPAQPTEAPIPSYGEVAREPPAPEAWPEPTGPPLDVGPAPRRARSVDPRELLATKDDDTPNVGLPPEPAAAESATADRDGGGATASKPGVADTGELDVPRAPRTGERACPMCGEPNAETRRFCLACGTKLPAAAPDEGPDAGDDDGGGRRGRRQPRTWRQRARAASRGPMRYTDGFSTEAKARVVMLVIGGIAAITALVTVGRERVMGMLGWEQEGTPPAGAELITPRGEEGEEVAGFGAANIHDDDRETGVAVVWEPDADGEPNRIRLRLQEPADVREVRIAAGLADDAADAPLMLQPSRVRVCADSGGCQEIELADSASLESYDVDLGDEVQQIELTVLAVRETEATTYPLTVISEVRIVV